VFDELERIADTLLGVSIAWAFSYVLPSWERHQVAALVARAKSAQVRYARVSLSLGHMALLESAPELEWRLARRECFETLSALVQATQRALSEPRAVQPALEPLGRILALSYQLLAQLTSIKTMLLLRRDRLELAALGPLLQDTSSRIASALQQTEPGPIDAAPASDPASGFKQFLPDPFEGDLTPWLTRRLALSADLAMRIAEVPVGALPGDPGAPERPGGTVAPARAR